MVSPSRESVVENFWELYRAGRFFEAHEVLEDLWRVTTGPERERLHGLIHGAVARYHHESGNAEGAARQNVRAHVRLARFAADASLTEARFLQELDEAIAGSRDRLDPAARRRLQELEDRLLRERVE